MAKMYQDVNQSKSHFLPSRFFKPLIRRRFPPNFADLPPYVYSLQSGPSSFPRAALLTTLRVCVRIWDGVGFGVRVSEIKATNLIMIFVSHRVVP